MANPPSIGSVWTARVKVYDDNGKIIGTCMDTPNSIAKMFMQVEKANMVKDDIGRITVRSDYTNRMTNNEASSFWVEKRTR